MIVVSVFAMFVDMVTLFGCLDWQQHEWAIARRLVFAVVTDFPPFLIPAYRFTLVYASELAHLVIIGECLQKLPFNAVRCAQNSWWICGRHQNISFKKLISLFYWF
jgi:hypothetical protein